MADDTPSWLNSSAAPANPAGAAPAWLSGGGAPPPQQAPQQNLFGDKQAPYGVAGLVAGQDQQPQQPQWIRRTLNPREAALSPQEKFMHGIADPDHPNLWNYVYGMSGAFQESATNGLMAQPVRAAMEYTPLGGMVTGIDMNKLRRTVPGMTDQWYKDTMHQMYSDAVTGARQQAHQAQVDNPYPGHQVGNFLANVAGSADPTWLIAPGRSSAKSALARIGVQSAKMAGLGSVSNAAAQTMDRWAGQKKDFDITQNLEAAGFSGVFGGAHASLSEVSPFVKQLFGNRGIDTTPPADPRMDTTPMTGQSVSMTPEDRETLRGLLKTGSVDDIKGFLDQKQGPKPSWQQIDQMVQMRDSLPPEGMVNHDNVTQAVSQNLDDLHRQVVSDHIDAQTANWKNKPDFEVINHTDEIQDPKVRAEAKASGADNPNSLGFYGSDGKVRIFANRMESPEMLNGVLYHEALGHYGLEQQFGNRLDSVLQTLDKRNVGQFSKEVDAWQERNPNAYGGDRTRAAEEVLAQASEKGPLKPAWHDAVTGALRQFGRRMGMKLSYSDAEVSHMLALAHDAVINGKTVRGNNFQGTKPRGEAPNTKWLNMGGEDATPSKYMFTGPHAAGFDPEHGFTASDGVQRNEISDANSRFNEPKPDTTTPLHQILDHPELYENYPHLRDLPVTHTKMEGLDAAYSDRGNGRIYLNTEAAGSKHSAVLHEVQHAIQQHEGITAGDNMKMSDEEYNAQPIEQEAHATEDRLNMSPEERAANPVRFATKSEMTAMGDYQIQNMERAYEATDRDYVPTTETTQETARKALDAGFSPSQIKALGNTPDLAKRIARITGAAKVLDQRISGILQKLDTPDWSARDADALRQAIADHSYILSKMRDERAAVARALNISKMGYTRGQMESFGALLKEHGGTLGPLGDDDTLVKFARTLKTVAGGHNPNGMNAAVSSLSKPNWEDYLTTLHQNMMLSGMSTHVKAPTDMIIGIGRDLLNSTGALVHTGVVDTLNAIPGVNLKPGVHPVEASMRMWGVLKAALDAGTYQRTAAAFANGGPSPSGFGGKGNARIPVISKVTDLISAQDAFFRSFATNMHLYGLASREAVAEARASGGKMDFDTLINQASAKARNPSTSLLKEAREAADTTLLLNKNAFTEPLDRFKNTTPNSSGLRRFGAFWANFLTPFVRVESNSIYNRVIRNSPLTVLDPQTYRELAAGGEKAGIAMARVVFALAPMAYYWQAAGQGKVTGEGPDNPDKKMEMEAGGWRPNAVHENGQYNTGDKLGISLNPWDLHNATATSVASMREAYEKGANEGQWLTGLKMAALSSIKSLTQMSWVNDIAPAVDAFTAPNTTMGQKVDKLVANEAATMVPNLVGQAARVSDQAQPDTSEPSLIPGTVKAAIPGLREQMPVRYTPYGDPVQSGASLAGTHTWAPQDNRITGGNHVNETADPAEQELERLGSLMANGKALITPVQRTVHLDGQDQPRKLTAQEYSDYQHMVGREIVEHVRQAMTTSEWQNMSDEQRAEEVRSIQTDMKKAVREHLFNGQ